MFQFLGYAIGIVGMVSHFAFGNWTGLWWSAALVLASVIVFALNLLPPLWVGFGRGVAETGMFAAICFLLLAASLGLLMGIEETRGFLLGNLVTSLGGHVTFAAIGWVTLTICASSYRFIPAFILPKKPLPRIALWQVVALAVATLGLGTSLMLRFLGSGAGVLLRPERCSSMRLSWRRSWGVGGWPSTGAWVMRWPACSGSSWRSCSVRP